ncbi:MAG: ABC-three component system middle component 5 [Bacteroidota bacterium]
MLVYHPAFDNYHCIVRVLKLLNNMPNDKYSIDRIKMYDYLLLFPNDLRKLTLPTAWNNFKNIKAQNRFNEVQNSMDIYNRISGFQNIALNALATFGVIDQALFNKDFIKLTKTPVDISLSLTDVEVKLFDFINRYLNNLSLKELKERTKLMNHKHELS